MHEFYIFRVGSVAEYNFTPCDSVLTLLCASSRELLFIKFHLLNEVNFIIAGSVASVNCLVYTIHRVQNMQMLQIEKCLKSSVSFF